MPERPPELGTRATVVMDHYTHGPSTLGDDGAGLRKVTVFPGPSEDFYVDGAFAVRGTVPVDVLALDSTSMVEPLVEEISIVSHYTLQVALYALQQIAALGGSGAGDAPEIAARALKLIGTSGDCEHHIDGVSLMPLQVDAPSDWKAV